jgi:hypothetical protein
MFYCLFFIGILINYQHSFIHFWALSSARSELEKNLLVKKHKNAREVLANVKAGNLMLRQRRRSSKRSIS